LDDEDKKYEFSNDDYFVISTNNQAFKKGSQVFNNYGICSNEYLLVNLGFCLLDNPGDKTKVVLSFFNPEKKLKKFLVDNFIDDFINKESYNKDKGIYIRLYIKRSKISTKILKILRFKIYGNNNKFDKKKEIECLENYIVLIQKNITARNYSHFKLINSIKEMIFTTGIKDENLFNIYVFKLTQKLNLICQKEAINNMINILKNDKSKINNFKNFVDEIEKSDKIKSIYLKNDDLKTMIKNYLNKLIISIKK
jgi:hypothetical protein